MKISVLFIHSSVFLFFPSCISQKLYNAYILSAYQATTLLSEIFYLGGRAVCKLRLASYGSKHTSQSLSETLFCAYLTHNSKTTGHIRTFYMYLSDDCSTVGRMYFVVRAVCEIWAMSYGSNHTLQRFPLQHFVHTYTHNSKATGYIWTFYISNNCSTIGDIVVWLRVAWEIRLESYWPKTRIGRSLIQHCVCIYTASLCMHCYLVRNYAWQQKLYTLWLHTTHQSFSTTIFCNRVVFLCVHSCLVSVLFTGSSLLVVVNFYSKIFYP